MPFPFVAPLKTWTVDKLKERESNRNYITTLSPFAMMTSGAVVMKDNKTSEEIKDLFRTQEYGDNAYYGCVITNTTDVSKLYQTGNTIVGYDLNGKEIKTEGEKNRRVSTPIIESIEIDTDGGNNTLKTAQVKVKVFTLKQLEMFELFFLRPSMNVVLEYGWGSDIRNKSKKYTIDSKLFAKKDFKKYKEDYSAVFLDAKKKKTEYLQTLEDLQGEYDYMVGKVTNFTYSPQEDGTYEINIEVSAGNELQLWPALKSGTNSSSTVKKDKIPVTNYESFIKKIVSDLGVPKLQSIFADENEWKNEFFNYGIVNDTQKNTIVSKIPYISLRSIIKIINELRLVKYSSEDGIVFTYEYNGTPIIPINSNPNLISTNEYVIFPGDLPEITLSKDSAENEIVLLHKTDKRIDGKINGKSFNIDNSPIYKFENPVSTIATTNKVIKDLDENKNINVKSNIGNLLNVFFSYERFLEIFNNGNSIADIINPVLETISDAMLGMVSLELQKPNDSVAFSGLEIIDRKIPLVTPEKQPTDATTKSPYKFKIGAIESIVKNFTFNMEMSTLMQAQALYSTQLAIAKRNNKTNTDASKEIDVNYTSADLSYAKNADGYFSINDMEVEIIKRSPKTTNVTNSNKNSKDAEKQLNDSIQSKYIKFLIDDEIKNLIYKDSSIVQSYILPKVPAQSMSLTYLDISLEIDGLAGFSCGEYFQIEGIPEMYNRNGYFQITNVKQGIDSSGWKTTIEAGYLLKNE